VPDYIQALANLGRIDQALELVDATDPWSEGVRAYLLLRLGKHEDVIRLLRATTIDPSWTWVQQTLISALLLTGRYEEARAEAAGFARIISERTEEAEFLLMMAFFEEVQGRLDRAVELAERRLSAEQGFGEGDAATRLGEVLLLRGDRDAGLRLLEQAVSCYRDRELDDWQRIKRPRLEALARWHGVELDDLDVLEAIVDRRRDEVAATSTPLTELAQAPRGTADLEIVRSARALGTVLVHLAGGDEARVGEALAEVGAGFEDEVSSLRRHLRSLAHQRRHAELAARAVHLSSTADRTAASNVLGQLLDEVPDETDTLLRQEATGDELIPVAGVLAELASNPRYELPATNVLRWLDMADPEPEASFVAGLQLELPSSWFADYADPLHEHPLFLRYLPELRALADWQVPAVRVVAEDELEPDRYRIWIDGERLDEGRVQPGARYCSAATIGLLATDLRSAATTDPDLALCWFPAAAVQRGSLADLLTMPTVEVLARLVGDAAKRLAERRTRAK
jgi:tetratricopeptide (TPR) repeat protein